MNPRPGSDTPDQDPNGQQGPNDSAQTPGGTAVERIIERFGGIRPMAHKLDIPVTTVQGWKKRGAIPLNRHSDLRSAAGRHGITLDEAELDAATPSEERGTGNPPGVYDPVSELQPAAVEPSANDAAPGAGSAAPVGQSAEDEPVVASPPPPPPREERRSGGSGFATVASVLALIAAAAALTQPWWMPRNPPPPAVPPAAVQSLEQRVGQIDQRVQQLASRPAGGDAAAQVQPLTDRIAALEQRVQEAPAQGQGGEGQATVDLAPLENRIAALEQRPAQSPEDPRVAELADKLSAVQGSVNSVQETVGNVQQRVQQVSERAGTADKLAQEVNGLKQQIASLQQELQARRDATTAVEALVLAAGQLRSALATNQPFQNELQGVRQLGVNDPQVAQALDAVAPYAPKGIPTRPTLTDRFSTLASDIVRAANKGDGTNWLDQVGGTLSTLVTVRQQGAGVVGDSAQAIVARTEAALQEGNLAQAVKEAQALQGPAAEAASGWLADAKARLAADEAARQIGARSIALLGQSAGGQKGAAQ